MKPAKIAFTLFSIVGLVHTLSAQPKPDGQKPGRKLALLVGNQTYSKLRPLPAVPKEVELVRTALADSGFQITSVKDANNDELTKALDGFVAGVRKGDICFFYYSGYAAQDGEDDFLLPTDFDPSATGLDSNSAYLLTSLAKNLGDKQEAFGMFFLEAARKPDVIIRNARTGLRKPYTGDLREVLFAIPAAAGKSVDTPPDQVGLFTKALVEVMNTSVPLSALMQQVLKKFSEVKDQQPDSENKITQEFYFHPPPPPPPPRSQNHTDREFYVWIPPGKFLMGCVPGTKCDKEEQPQHQVTLTKGFWMGENEVQVVSYRKFVTSPDSQRSMPAKYHENQNWQILDQPISNVSWEDARDYCTWAGGRLPTEAEWEYAARGGKDNDIYPFDATDEQKSRDGANFAGKSGNDQFSFAAPVRRFNPNGFQLYDMSGNVWELVSDFFGPYKADPVVDPKGPKTGKHHVQRGGSYDSDPKTHLRISFREENKVVWPNIGFRCVIDDSPKTHQLLQIP